MAAIGSCGGGRTFDTIIRTLDELGYDCQWQVLNSKNHGVPQNRERIIIVGHLRGTSRPQVFPIGQNDTQDTRLSGHVSNTLTARYEGAQANGTYIGESQLDAQEIRQLNNPPYSNDRVYGADGVSPTLNTMQGGNRQPFVKVPEATKKGYTEATVGDSINLGQINSKTRRGRVGVGVANTLDTGQTQYTLAVPVLTPDRAEKRQNGRRFKNDGEPSFTLTSQDRHGIYNGARIRRLTPTECMRLQGFPDNWCDYAADGTPISDTQKYKMAGNAVTTNVIQAVFEEIFK